MITIKRLEEWEEMCYNTGGASEETQLVEIKELQKELMRIASHIKGCCEFNDEVDLSYSSGLQDLILHIGQNTKFEDK